MGIVSSEYTLDSESSICKVRAQGNGFGLHVRGFAAFLEVWGLGGIHI